MFGFLGKIFGSDTVVNKGMDFIDDLHYSDSEEAEDNRKTLVVKTEQKIRWKEAFHPYKLAQRFIAFSFVGVYIFIMLNGVIGSLYGFVNMDNVDNALNFANKMYLGEITLTIIIFYFGDTALKKFTNKGK